MDRLSPIPTPRSQWWREFRVRAVPFGVFLAATITVTLIWRQNVSAPTLVGEVETVHANVSSPKPGKLAQLNATRLQRVKAGDVIAKVITTDPQIIQSSLAVIQAEIRLLRVNLQPVLGQQRYALNYDHLRLDWMDQRVQLASERVRLELAEVELHRNEELFKDKIVSEGVLDASRTARDTLQTQVKERASLVAEQEQKLKTLGLGENASSFPEEVSPDDVLQASIKVQEEKLRLTEVELSPITLTVPMDGTISTIHHRSGEAIVAGEPIVTLTALSSDRILGYVRQPLTFQPRVGMKVEVRARSLNRCISEAEVVQVGSQMEAISATLQPVSNTHYHEVGLPILVSMPSSQKLMPGEIVDLRIMPSREQPALRDLDGVTLH
jgi:multidrug resistance efflux pump